MPPRTVSGACPTSSKATVLEASRGGHRGDVLAGRGLMATAKDLVAFGSEAERIAKVAEVRERIAAGDGEVVLGWFERELPRCMVLIPARRRASVLAGNYEEVDVDDECLAP
jgi:hypothetical protein